MIVHLIKNLHSNLPVLINDLPTDQSNGCNWKWWTKVIVELLLVRSFSNLDRLNEDRVSSENSRSWQNLYKHREEHETCISSELQKLLLLIVTTPWIGSYWPPGDRCKRPLLLVFVTLLCNWWLSTARNFHLWCFYTSTYSVRTGIWKPKLPLFQVCLVFLTYQSSSLPSHTSYMLITNSYLRRSEVEVWPYRIKTRTHKQPTPSSVKW